MGKASTTCPHGYRNPMRDCATCKYEAQFPEGFTASRFNPAGRNFDYPMPQEGRMAKSYLWTIEKDARALRKKLRDDDDLPGWVQAKIVTAQDRIGVVNRYMGHKIARAEGRAKTNPSGTDALKVLALVGLGVVLYRTFGGS